MTVSASSPCKLRPTNCSTCSNELRCTQGLLSGPHQHIGILVLPEMLRRKVNQPPRPELLPDAREHIGLRGERGAVFLGRDSLRLAGGGKEKPLCIQTDALTPRS